MGWDVNGVGSDHGANLRLHTEKRPTAWLAQLLGWSGNVIWIIQNLPAKSIRRFAQVSAKAWQHSTFNADSSAKGLKIK